MRLKMLKRGQLNILAVAGFAIAIIFIIYLSTRESSTETDKKHEQIKLEELATKMKQLESLIIQKLKEESHGAVEEMALHGGYTSENLPSLKHKEIAYWFYMGKIVNIPTVEHMEAVLSKEIERRMNEEFNVINEELELSGDQYGFSYPSVTVKLDNHTVTVDMTAPYYLKDKENNAKSELTFHETYNLRLKYLRDLAEEYVENYNKIRMMESILLNGMKQDDRIYEPPGRLMHSVPCSNPPYRSYNELITPIRQNVQLASGREIRRIRALFNESKYVDWATYVEPHEVKFSFTADNGGRGYENERIYLVPITMPPFSPNSDVCISFFVVQYNIHFPIRVSLTDLFPTTQIIHSAQTEGLLRPLIFNIYLEPYLGANPDGSANIFAVNESVNVPATVRHTCEGSCSINLDFENSEKGSLWLDDCKYMYTAGSFAKENIACGVRNLVVRSTHPADLAKYISVFNLHKFYEASIKIPKFVKITGKVYGKQIKLCRNAEKIELRPDKPLYYIQGFPSRFIDIYLVPLDFELGTVVHTFADENGRYSFDYISPGKYLIVASPSRDESNMIGYKFMAEGGVYTIKEGLNEIDIKLDPLQIETLKGKYYEVTEVSTEC